MQIKSSMNSKAYDDDLTCYWENNLLIGKLSGIALNIFIIICPQALL